MAAKLQPHVAYSLQLRIISRNKRSDGRKRPLYHYYKPFPFRVCIIIIMAAIISQNNAWPEQKKQLD